MTERLMTIFMCFVVDGRIVLGRGLIANFGFGCKAKAKLAVIRYENFTRYARLVVVRGRDGLWEREHYPIALN